MNKEYCFELLPREVQTSKSPCGMITIAVNALLAHKTPFSTSCTPFVAMAEPFDRGVAMNKQEINRPNKKFDKDAAVAAPKATMDHYKGVPKDFESHRDSGGGNNNYDKYYLVGGYSGNFGPAKYLKDITPLSRVAKADVIMALGSWKDQGSGDRKGHLFIVRNAEQEIGPAWKETDQKLPEVGEKLAGGDVVVRSPRAAPHAWENYRLEFTTPSDVAPTDRYSLWATVGGGGGHELFLAAPQIEYHGETLSVPSAEEGNIKYLETHGYYNQADDETISGPRTVDQLEEKYYGDTLLIPRKKTHVIEFLKNIGYTTTLSGNQQSGQGQGNSSNQPSNQSENGNMTGLAQRFAQHLAGGLSSAFDRSQALVKLSFDRGEHGRKYKSIFVEKDWDGRMFPVYIDELGRTTVSALKSIIEEHTKDREEHGNEGKVEANMQILLDSHLQVLSNDQNLMQLGIKYGDTVSAKLERRTAPRLLMKEGKTMSDIRVEELDDKGAMTKLSTVEYKWNHLYNHQTGDPNVFAPYVFMSFTPYCGKEDQAIDQTFELRMQIKVGVEERTMKNTDVRRGFFIDMVTILVKYNEKESNRVGELVSNVANGILKTQKSWTLGLGVGGNLSAGGTPFPTGRAQRTGGHETSNDLHHWRHHPRSCEDTNFYGWQFERGTWDENMKEEYNMRDPEKSLKKTKKLRAMKGFLKKVPMVTTQFTTPLLPLKWEEKRAAKNGIEYEITVKVEMRLRDIDITPNKDFWSIGSYSRTFEVEDTVTVAKFVH